MRNQDTSVGNCNCRRGQLDHDSPPVLGGSPRRKISGAHWGFVIVAVGKCSCRSSAPTETDSADRSGIQAERSVAVFGGVGRASWNRRGTMREEDGDQAVWSAGGSGAGAGSLQGCNTVILHRGQRLVASRPGVGGAYASARQANRLGTYADPCKLAKPGGNLFFDHPEEGVDAKRFCEAGGDSRAPGVIRGVEQPQTETVRMEVYSTRHAELAKTRVAAFSDSFRCVEKGTGQPRRYL
jgi:hypothetical protein